MAELEKREAVDQRRKALREFLAANAALFRVQGSVVETWRKRGGRRTGPYYRLAFRDGGTQRSLYLGSDRESVEEVRRLLRELHGPLTKRTAQKRQRRFLRKALARSKDEWRQELATLGLELKGCEVRGWRCLHRLELEAGRRFATLPSAGTGRGAIPGEAAEPVGRDLAGGVR